MISIFLFSKASIGKGTETLLSQGVRRQSQIHGEGGSRCHLCLPRAVVLGIYPELSTVL